MEASRHEVLAYMSFPKAHHVKLHSTSPLERLNKEIKRRTKTVEISPNVAAIIRLVGALLAEQNDEWAIARNTYIKWPENGPNIEGENQPVTNITIAE